MFRKKTVFVLGAGASKPYGFPTGQELIEEIVRAPLSLPAPREIDADEDERELFEERLSDFASALGASNQPSIDEFLKRRPEYSEIGKLILAWHIASREADAALLSPATPEHWLRELWPYMDADPGEFETNNVAFIVFNYDRCVEHFLARSLQASYGLDPQSAWEAVSRISIVHPHGLVGAYQPTMLGGRRVSRDGAARSFVPIQTCGEAQRVAQSIRLFWEEPERLSAVTSRVESAVQGAFCVVFLGYGFLRSNMDLLDPIVAREASRSVNWIFATTCGLGQQAHQQVHGRFGKCHALPFTGLNLLRDHLPLRKLCE